MNGSRLDRCYLNCSSSPYYEFLLPPVLPRIASKPLPPLPVMIQSTIPQTTTQNLLTNSKNYVRTVTNFETSPSNSSSLLSNSSLVPIVPSTWSQGTINERCLPRGTLDSSTKASALLDNHDRFKPERVQRRPVQRMKWAQSRLARSLAGDLFSSSPSPATGDMTKYGKNHQFSLCNKGFQNNFPSAQITDHLPLESESRVSSMTIADVSPRLAVKKVLLLYEHAHYREAANFIQRLSVGTFRIILRELPLDILIDAMPNSLPIIEALYTKVFGSDGPNGTIKILKPETIVLHMVKFFSKNDLTHDESCKVRDCVGPFVSSCKRILRVIVIGDPKVLKSLQQRRKSLDKAVEGMGQHGLVGTTDESLLPFHDALKLDFRRVMDAYKGALQKLEDLSLSNKNHLKHVSHGPAPIQASHQRQLSLRADEIQDRLIKNKSLLNVIEPTLDNHCLDILLGILQRRIECDKEALFQYTQLRKETGDSSSETVVAPLLMRYSRGCRQVIEMMKEVGQEIGGNLASYDDDSSDLSGYHSDSDSAIMTSGNSPFVSPRARYNFLSRSVRCKTAFRQSIIPSSLSSSSSGVGNGDSGSGSFGSSLPDEPSVGRLVITPPPLVLPNSSISNQPTRLRHIKQRNHLQKNNSLGLYSSGESESSGSLRGENEFPSVGSVDYVTVVSVPEDQVISQGINQKSLTIIPSPDSSSTNGKRILEFKNEINQLRRALQTANLKISQLQEKDKPGDENYETQTINPGRSISSKEESRGHFVRLYGSLYATARVETMDALDSIPDLVSADELKSKLLFSVVVLSFRSVQTSVGEMMKQIQKLLQMSSGDIGNNNALSPPRPSINSSKTTSTFTTDGYHYECYESKVFEAVSDYLRNSAQKFDLSKAMEQVANQLWTTLYDYPCLKRCDVLTMYIRTCVTLAWGLSNLTPPCTLEHETRIFSRDMHVRFHSSNQSNDTIKTYLWPALIEGQSGNCVHKGVVIT